MLLTGIALFTYPRQIVGLYLNLNDPANASAVDISISIMKIAALGLFLDGLQRTANGVLQGLQDTRITVLLGIVAYWGIGLTMSYLLGFNTPLSGQGVWIGTQIGVAAAGFAYLWRIQRVMLKKK